MIVTLRIRFEVILRKSGLLLHEVPQTESRICDNCTRMLRDWSV